MGQPTFVPLALPPTHEQTFGVYVHVPFCSTRCGYCDFNTYTAGELGAANSPERYLNALERELELAAQLRAEHGDTRPAETVFIGGGTPSLLGAEGLARILRVIRRTTGITPGAEITTESNPESTSPAFFQGLADAGFNRVSLGMQSASSSVLKVLERNHTPGRAFAAIREAQEAGFVHLNLDIIYGTPTETEQDLADTVEQVLAIGVDHISAYSLIVEPGTRMARQVAKGLLTPASEELYASRYEYIDAQLQKAGFSWYEVSNWAKSGGQCQHNLNYWRNQDWWGAGPGAHSHMDGVRFVHAKHPSTYAQGLEAGILPLVEVEQLSPEERHIEQLMLGLRVREGIAQQSLSDQERARAQRFLDGGLLELSNNRLRVSATGRLLADGIIAELLFGA